MAQSELTRLLIVPAIVLAAALSLSGCAALPFAGSDPGSSNNSSTSGDDEGDDDDADEDVTEGSCPQQFLDGMAGASERNASISNFSIRELSADEFEPAAISELVEGGCLFTMVYDKDGSPVTMYQGMFPGGADVLAEVGEALLADGYESGSEGFYFNAELLVRVFPSEDAPYSSADLDQMGLGFLGDEYILLTAYTG